MRNAEQQQQSHRLQLTAATHVCPLNVQRRDLFEFIRRCMWLTAMYPLPFVHRCPPDLRPVAVLIDVFYEVFMYFVLVHIDVLYICTFYLNLGKGDLELLVSCVIQTIIYTWGFGIKLFFKRINPKGADALMQYINDLYKPCSAMGFTYVTMDSSLALSVKKTKFFLYSCCVGVISWSVLPIVYQDRSLPLPCWYPIDYKAPVVYECIYLLQIVGQLQVACAFATSASYYGVMSVLFSAQYDILNCSLKNIVATAYISMRMPREQILALREYQHTVGDTELNQYFCSIEKQIDVECIDHLLDEQAAGPTNFRAAFQLALKSCIAHHRYILNGLNLLEKFYSFILFFKSLQVTVLICLVMFATIKSNANESLLKLLVLGQYLVLILWDMFIICYAGDSVFQNSQRCGEALLRSPWYLHMTEVKSDCIFFMLNAQRPYKLTAGKLYNLNFNRFRNMLTSSFSFFTILQKMDKRNEHTH